MSKNYLTEAFKKLNILDEDVFDVDDGGIAKLKEFEYNDSKDTSVQIIDPNAEDETELEDNYIGKVILDCSVCHSKIYRNKEDVTTDDGLANVGEECPFCYSPDGFKVIGEVAKFNDDEDVDVRATEDGEGTDIDVDVDEKEKNESLKRHKASHTIKESQERRVIRGRNGKLTEAPIYDLGTRYDSRQSFYGKAKVDTGNKGDGNKLYSYNTLVAEIKDGKPVVYGTYSQTTLRHIKDWLLQHGFKALNSKQIMADYGVKDEALGESLDGITIDTGDQEISVTAHDKDSEEIDTESEETIKPLSDDTESEIEDNNIDVDVDEFDDKTFDDLGESYLKKAYDNVKAYRTTSVVSDGNQLKLEGVITFGSGNKKKTNFVFESKDITKSGKARFIGENLQICKGRKAFTITGTLSSKKFMPESLNYNYKAKDSVSGISKRVYGTISKKN